MALDDHDQLQNDNWEIDVGLRQNPQSLAILRTLDLFKMFQIHFP